MPVSAINSSRCCVNTVSTILNFAVSVEGSGMSAYFLDLYGLAKASYPLSRYLSAAGLLPISPHPTLKFLLSDPWSNMAAASDLMPFAQVVASISARSTLDPKSVQDAEPSG